MSDDNVGRETQVKSQCGFLSAAVEMLFHELDELGSRLAIISDTTPRTGVGGEPGQKESKLCPHAEFLREQATEIKRAAEHVEIMRARLEI